MNVVLQPWQLFFLIVAGWINRQQQQVIEYLRTENQVLREKLGKRRILLDDDQRRRLAVKGKILGRKLLAQVGTLVTPDTRPRKARNPRTGKAVDVPKRLVVTFKPGREMGQRVGQLIRQGSVS
jgi:hypothetical protein